MAASRNLDGRLLLTTWIVAPVLWLTQLSAVYALATMVCETQRKLPLYGVAAISAAVLAGAGYAAWRGWARAAFATVATPRTRFVALIGLALGALLLLVVAAQLLAIAVLVPCD